jgi:hypothetical protein
MRKLFFAMAVIAIFIMSCEPSANDITPEQAAIEVDMSDFYLFTNDDNLAAKGTGNASVEKCFTMKMLNIKLAENPGLYQKMYEIEKHTREFIGARKPDGTPGGGNGGGGSGDGGGGGTGDDITPYGDIVGNTIPVVFHIIYSSESENISIDRLNEQIVALNEDFNSNNPNRNLIPGDFAGLEADLGVNFVIAGVIRKQNKKKKSWRPDDSMKFSSSGGSDAFDPLHYLNVWVVNNMPYQGGNILGYAQFPGGDWATDGIVLDRRFVGINTTYGSTGRTATHEIGHWMNLRHIWGDGGCSQDDFVLDTPVADRYNTGCPNYPDVVHCTTPDMFMNFMDYTSDACMKLFTNGQEARMAAQFDDGGFRELMGITIN